MRGSYAHGRYDKEHDGAPQGGTRLPRASQSQDRGGGHSSETRGTGASGERLLRESKLISSSGV